MTKPRIKLAPRPRIRTPRPRKPLPGQREFAFVTQAVMEAKKK